MRLWIREVAGWLLVLLGLFLFYRCYGLLTDPEHSHILEGGSLSLVGIIVFRGGIHLLKIAVAAEVCLEAQDRLDRDQPGPAAGSIRSRPGRTPVGAAPRPSRLGLR
jgi:hypothetical protein